MDTTTFNDIRRIPFSEEDERRIASAATWGQIIAITSIISAAVSLAMQAMVISRISDAMSGTMADIIPWFMLIPLAGALFSMVINVWLLQASRAFRRVAVTDEADQIHLLEGFRKLRAYFMTVVIAILVSLGAALLMMVSNC